jgi:hypothetical protein
VALDGTPSAADGRPAGLTLTNWDLGGEPSAWAYLHAGELFRSAEIRPRRRPAELERAVGCGEFGGAGRVVCSDRELSGWPTSFAAARWSRAEGWADQ